MAKLQLHKNASLKLWMISILIANVQTNSCNDVSDFVKKNIGLIDSYIWNGKAQTIDNCARMCVARKPCQSINYDFTTKICELNSGTLENRTTKTGGTLVYSSFAWWPASIDEACFSRPCADDQVCISGRVATATQTECSYTCMSAGRKVCPWPDIGIRGGRYVGDTNVLTCGPGFIGSDIATCLDTGQWDKEMSCTEILNHICTNDTFCSDISAVCEDGRCTCGTNIVYDNSTSRCSLDCGDPQHIAGTTLNGTSTNMVLAYTCGPEPVRQKLGTDDGIIRCLETGFWEQTNFECFGLRMTMNELKTGFLEIFTEGDWGYVRYEEVDDWNWQATNVACRQLGYGYGGSYHVNRQARHWLSKYYRLDNMKCDENADGLDLCSYNISSHDSHDGVIALTCFEFELQADIYVHDYANRNSVGGSLWVKIGNYQRPVCTSNWGENETSVACKTFTHIDITSPTNKYKHAISFSCDGSEPHLLFCRNYEWIYNNNNCHRHGYVNITC